MRLSHVLIALALTACSGGDEPAQEDPQALAAKAKAEAEAAAKAKAEAEEEPDKGAAEPSGPKGLAAAQQHDRSVPAIEEALSGADDAGLWALLKLEAAAGGETEALLGRLDPAAPLGGAAAAHHRLRAELALAAKRPADAFSAANALADSAPEDAATLKALAVRAGAKADTSGLDPEDAADALLLAAIQPTAKAAKALSELDLKGWRARLLRAGIAQEAEDIEAAKADLAAIMDGDDPEGLIAAAERYAALHDDPAAGADALTKAAKAAHALSSGAEAARLTALATSALLDAGRAVDAVAFAKEMHAARQGASDHKGAAVTGQALARANTAQGDLSAALEAASSAVVAAEAHLGASPGAPQDLLHAAARTRVHVALLLGDRAALSEGLGNLSSDDKATAEALLAGLRGDPEGALAQLGGRQGADLFELTVQRYAARFALLSGADAAPFAARAVSIADALGRTSLRVEARLEQARIARLQQRPAGATLDELANIAESLGAAGAPLAAEVAARRALNGEVTAMPEGELGALAADWTPLITGEVPEAFTANGAPESAVAKLGVARKLLGEGNFAEAYPLLQEGLAALPRHHRGPWAPISVLGGAEASGVAPDLALLYDKDDPVAALCGLVLHEWWHGAREIDTAFAVGDDPSLALEDAQRRAYYAAHHALRQETLRWLIGAGPEPTEAREALAKLDAEAMKDKGFARAIPQPMVDYSELRESLQGTAVLSYRFGPSSGDALVVTSEGGKVVRLTDTAKLRRASDKLSAALRDGDAAGKAPVSPAMGDELRRALVDVFADQLTGIGRYLVISEQGFRDFTWAIFPEQQAGLRFLADIRSVGTSPTVSFTQRELPEPPERFGADYLGLDPRVRQTGKLQVAGELDQVSRQFTEEGRVLGQGDKATAALFLEKAPSARFIHLAGVSRSEEGGLALSESSLSFAEVRDLDLPAKLVVISGDLDPDARDRWSQAFLSAGAGAVVSTAWQIDAGSQASYLHRFFESTIQERAPSRAMFEARATLQSDDANPHFDPSWWGLYTLHGAP